MEINGHGANRLALMKSIEDHQKSMKIIEKNYVIHWFPLVFHLFLSIFADFQRFSLVPADLLHVH